MQHRTRQLKSRSIALLGQSRQRRPARITQAHELGRLIERLAGCIVEGFAQQRVAPHTIDPHELGVTARNQQGHERKIGPRVRQQR